MTWLALAAALVLAATVVGAAVARMSLWGTRLRPAVPSPERPEASLIFAAASERGRHAVLVPLLADWALRGVLGIERIGPHLPASHATSASSGPVWRFTAGAAVGAVDPVELVVLHAMFGALPQAGHSITVEREDVAWRANVSSSISRAVSMQRDRFGTERPRMPWLGPLLFLLAVLAGGGVLTGAALGGVSTPALAWLSVGVPVTVAVAGTLALWPAASPAERRYRQATRNLRSWVRTTDAPVRELGGWAMIWNLPGRWSEVLPPEVTGLLHLDRSFLRGDFSRTIAEPYTG